jgi:uncharacterized protein (DUF362 family)/Pyruvate/2-oxoacid:ferredoxin oxidoreductase delta subunit
VKRATVKRIDTYETEELKKVIYEALDDIGGVGKYIKKGMKIALKPNLVMKKPPEFGITTNPAVVKAVGEIIREQGAQAILVESPGGTFTRARLKSIYDVTGMTKACGDCGAALNFDVDAVCVRNDEGLLVKSVTVIKALEEVDAVINLPKLKTHGQMTYTGAVKNMFGIVPGVLKAEHHFRTPNYDDFANSIIDIFLSKKPALSIIDAIETMEGAGPSAGVIRKLGCLMLSDDAFFLDYVACRIINLDCMDVPILRQAIKRGYLVPQANEEETHMINEFFCRDFKIPLRYNPKVIDFSDLSPSGKFLGLLKPKPVFNRKKCILCAECVRCCPAKVLSIQNKKVRIDLDNCIRCYCCQELCPEKAVSIKRGLIIEAFLKMNRLLDGRKK